jgi:hypothetical protein
MGDSTLDLTGDSLQPSDDGCSRVVRGWACGAGFNVAGGDQNQRQEDTQQDIMLVRVVGRELGRPRMHGSACTPYNCADQTDPQQYLTRTCVRPVLLTRYVGRGAVHTNYIGHVLGCTMHWIGHALDCAMDEVTASHPGEV